MAELFLLCCLNILQSLQILLFLELILKEFIPYFLIFYQLCWKGFNWYLMRQLWNLFLVIFVSDFMWTQLLIHIVLISIKLYQLQSVVYDSPTFSLLPLIVFTFFPLVHSLFYLIRDRLDFVFLLVFLVVILIILLLHNLQFLLK